MKLKGKMIFRRRTDLKPMALRLNIKSYLYLSMTINSIFYRIWIKTALTALIPSIINRMNSWDRWNYKTSINSKQSLHLQDVEEGLSKSDSKLPLKSHHPPGIQFLERLSIFFGNLIINSKIRIVLERLWWISTRKSFRIEFCCNLLRVALEVLRTLPKSTLSTCRTARIDW